MLPFNMGAGGASGVDTGDIPASLRFRSAASAYLSRTFGTPTNVTMWTWSGWIKRGSLGAAQVLLGTGSAAGPLEFFDFDASDRFYYTSQNAGSTNTLTKLSTRVFRDPSAHIHLVVQKNASATTGVGSIRVWVNNEEITVWTTNAYVGGTAVADRINSAVLHEDGRWNSAFYLNAYRSRICFVDGQALTPSSFGYFNTEINEWVSKSQSAVKAVVDAGGTNSFMLDFDDATSLTTLGYDKSSKGNNWTLNNFSLTAGTTYDHMLDVPGNSFPTFNAIEYAVNTFSDGNLKCVTSAGGSYTSGCTQFFPTTGKWYAEVTDTTEANTTIGIVAAGYSGLTQLVNQPSGYSYYATSGNKWNNGSSAAYGATYTSGDVIGIIFDADNGKLYFSKNGTIQNSGDPDAGTGYAYNGLTGTYCIAVGDGGVSAATLNLNCGQAPLHTSATYHSSAGGYFRYAPPTGYKALCQRNMPDPAILNPEKHFDVVTRTGTAATYSVAGLGFQPDLVWVKSRGRAVDHALYDSVRGVQKQLESNQTGAETTETTGITAFNSDGYTGGALDQINGTTATNSFVDWLWKAGGAAVTNNAGSISSQVSANVDAGFSIVTYTGTGANATVGHGLGKAPGLILNKAKALVNAWQVYHKNANASPASGKLFLNQTDAFTSEAALWNSTLPTSSVFNLGTSSNANGNGINYVAYCFAEIAGFSKIFSYTGNGNADGPFVHCGFKPKYVLIKRVDAADSWTVVDSVRNTYNVIGEWLAPNSSGAETTYAGWDFTSSGFKLRNTSPIYNASGGTYIGIAFADVPAKYSLAR